LTVLGFFYIGSSDKEQLSYTEPRLRDLEDLAKVTNIKPVLRVFTGDNPARQFESGQQRGGHFSCLCGVRSSEHNNFISCYTKEPITLEERRQHVVAGEVWQRITSGTVNPFQGLKKNEIVDELESRGIWPEDDKKSAVQEKLSEIMHGITRPPALCCHDPLQTTNALNIGSYEILACEPLHDLTNVIQNIIQELPNHVGEQNKQDFLSFSETTIGNKNQIKGSDARLYAVKLAKFTLMKYEEGKLDENIPKLINSLVDIVTICYSDYSTRSPKQLLRLHNQCFMFGFLCKLVIGNPKKLTTRKFYGNHFHSITIHVPETARMICLKSIVPEQEERSFGTLRRISENTTNRQPKYIVDNAMLRIQFQSTSSDPSETVAKQNSTISKQAKLLPPQNETIFSKTMIQKYPLLIQSHLERISDFILPGHNIWWSNAEGGIRFFDGPNDDTYRPQGPHLHHFRSTSLKQERIWIQQQWTECVDQYACGELPLPLHRLKIYKNGKIMYILPKYKGTHIYICSIWKAKKQ
jgi:hypothetical protein